MIVPSLQLLIYVLVVKKVRVNWESKLSFISTPHTTQCLIEKTLLIWSRCQLALLTEGVRRVNHWTNFSLSPYARGEFSSSNKLNPSEGFKFVQYFSNKINLFFSYLLVSNKITKLMKRWNKNVNKNTAFVLPLEFRSRNMHTHIQLNLDPNPHSFPNNHKRTFCLKYLNFMNFPNTIFS